MRTALIIALIVTGGTAMGGKHLEGIACRSVHLAYNAPQGTVFYNEMTVEQSAEGSYFMACGFRMGYFGIQEQRSGRKVVLFSVWDPGSQNDPKSVADDRKVRVLHHDPDVLVKRFGGEGTGGQSFFKYDWKIGERYKFMVKAVPNADRTAFSGYFYLPESDTWKHLVTFETISGGVPLKGYNSFVEDFRRNRVSTTHTRRARFGNGWVKDLEGEWKEMTTARFTADANPVMNINAGLNAGDFYLSTGGDITNTNTPLRGHMTRPANTNGAPGPVQ